jgi:hypothetical protein
MDVQAGLALSASRRHPEMLKLKIAERVLYVKDAVRPDTPGCGLFVVLPS